MMHAFTIVRRAPVSMSNVIANYLDLEHIPVHSGLKAAQVLAETDSTVCFRLDSKVLFFYFTNIHYFEYQPPGRVIQVVKTPLGPMRVTAETREFAGGTPGVYCETTVEVEIDLPRVVYFFRGPVEKLLRHLNGIIFKEDMTILARRQALFGERIEDYLRDGQYLMCKELFRRHFSKAAAVRRPGEAPAAPAGDARG